MKTSSSVGKKNKIGILQRPERVADADKGYETEYVRVAAISAEIAYTKAGSASPAEFVESVHATIKIWKRIDVVKGWHFVADGKTFDIKSAYPDNDGINTILNCEEVTP